MMNEVSTLLRDGDLSMILKILMPGHRNKQRMMRIMRQDSDILDGMLRDERLFKSLLDNPESIIRVSPYLFFTVILYRVRNKLKNQSYTVEWQQKKQTIVFDSERVNDFLGKGRVLSYLIEMLVSFVRINSFIIPIRVRKGHWQKLRFSDFDIDSLIRYSQMIDEEHRFGPYKRIADICLFITGIFPDAVGNLYLDLFGGRRRLDFTAEWNREIFEEHGKHFYGEAARHRAAHILDLHPVLSELAENFHLATKPLSFMSSHYLGLFKDRLFLQ